jgi:hypothetical protein
MIDWKFSDLESVAAFHVMHYQDGTIESWCATIKRHTDSAYKGLPMYVSTYAFVVMVWHDDNGKPHAKCAVTAYSANLAMKGK